MRLYVQREREDSTVGDSNQVTSNMKWKMYTPGIWKCYSVSLTELKCGKKICFRQVLSNRPKGVLINQRDATFLINDLYYPLVISTCFGLSPVHHQEHHLINCITYWYVRAIRRV